MKKYLIRKPTGGKSRWYPPWKYLGPYNADELAGYIAYGTVTPDCEMLDIEGIPFGKRRRSTAWTSVAGFIPASIRKPIIPPRTHRSEFGKFNTRRNFIESSDGFSLEFVGRDGIRYVDHGRVMDIASELYYDDGPISRTLYTSSIRKWKAPHENESVDK